MSSKDKYEGTVGAKAVVTVELQGLGAWGTGYTMDQIIDQATTEAEATIRKAFHGERTRIISIDTTAVYAPGQKIQPTR
ncbi:hypothetical protein, partial [Parvimonas sp. D9]|uniref:hypothetical protein n=1 Tax=Parvimonas sp. D9 TaxID=3110689 RepID=UPI002B474BD5